MKPMLAGKYVPEKVEGMFPMYVQPKMDGIRVFIREGVAYTRSLKPVRSQQFQSLVAHHKDVLEGMDGEIICGDPVAHNCYQRTMSSVMSFDQPDDELCFHIFDKWDEPLPFKDRLEVIENDPDWKELEWCQPLETFLVFDMDQLEVIMSKLFSSGHEGAILRHPDAFYKFGRGTPSKGELIKVKDGRWVDTEAVVIAQREEMENTNEATINALGHTERKGGQAGFVGKGTLGSIQVRGVFPEDDLTPAHVRGKTYECSIGSGFDAYQREVLWDEDLTGRIAKFKFFTTGIKDKPRFPIFLGWRDSDDMDPAEAEQLSLF